MKTRVFLLVFLCATLSNHVHAQDQNPKLNDTFTGSGGHLVTVDSWGEIKKSDLIYDDIKKMQLAVADIERMVDKLKGSVSGGSTARERILEELQRKVDDQQKTIDKFQWTVHDLQRTVEKLEREVNNLERKTRR